MSDKHDPTTRVHGYNSQSDKTELSLVSADHGIDLRNCSSTWPKHCRVGELLIICQDDLLTSLRNEELGGGGVDEVSLDDLDTWNLGTPFSNQKGSHGRCVTSLAVKHVISTTTLCSLDGICGQRVLFLKVAFLFLDEHPRPALNETPVEHICKVGYV